MSLEQLLWAAGGLLAVFWVVGAYNRLITMRHAAGEAWRQLDDLVQRRDEAAARLVARLQPVMPEEQATLDALSQSLTGLKGPAEQLRQRPLAAEPLTAYGNTLSAMTSPLVRLRSLVELQPALAQDAGLAPDLATLAEAEGRVPPLRQAFNEAAAQYNAARCQWPTRLVSLVFALSASGSL